MYIVTDAWYAVCSGQYTVIMALAYSKLVLLTWGENGNVCVCTVCVCGC